MLEMDGLGKIRWNDARENVKSFGLTERMHAPSIRSPVADEERMRSGHGFGSVLLSCFLSALTAMASVP